MKQIKVTFLDAGIQKRITGKNLSEKELGDLQEEFQNDVIRLLKNDGIVVYSVKWAGKEDLRINVGRIDEKTCLKYNFDIDIVSESEAI